MLEQVIGNGEDVTRDDVDWLDIPLHVSGWTIISLRLQSAKAELRKNNFTLLVAPEADGTAEGSLYLGDGDSFEPANTSDIHFSWDGTRLTAHSSFGFQTSIVVDKVQLMAQEKQAGAKMDGSWDLNGLFEASPQCHVSTVPQSMYYRCVPPCKSITALTACGSSILPSAGELQSSAIRKPSEDGEQTTTQSGPSLAELGGHHGC